MPAGHRAYDPRLRNMVCREGTSRLLAPNQSSQDKVVEVTEKAKRRQYTPLTNSRCCKRRTPARQRASSGRCCGERGLLLAPGGCPKPWSLLASQKPPLPSARRRRCCSSRAVADVEHLVAARRHLSLLLH